MAERRIGGFDILRTATITGHGVQYGAAGELLQLNWLGRTEYRTYNSRLQMTRVRITQGGLDKFGSNMSATINRTQRRADCMKANDYL